MGMFVCTQEVMDLEEYGYANIISDNYYRACYQKRNIWMVECSNLVIEVFNGTALGTKYYALCKTKEC